MKLFPIALAGWKIKCLTTLIFLVIACNNLWAQSWYTVGSPAFTDSVRYYLRPPSMAVDGNGTPYVFCVDYENDDRALVLKYDGNNWVTVGNADFSTPAISSNSIAIDENNVPYVIYIDAPGDADEIMKYTDTGWVSAGGGYLPGSDTYAAYTSIIIDKNNTPYMAVVDEFSGYNGRAFAAKYNDTYWVAVGNTVADTVIYPAIAADGNGALYMVYEDFNNNRKIAVVKSDGSNFETIGNPGFAANSNGEPLSIAIDMNSNTPYISYDSGNVLTVMKYDGSNWVTVGARGFSTGGVWSNSMVIDPSGTPYVVYTDYTDSQKATVMKYNGSSWVIVGNSGFSGPAALYASMALDRNGLPYVLFLDPNNSYKATVMRYGWPEDVKIIDNNIADVTLSVSPNPSYGSFTFKVASPQKEDAKIVITNVLGEKVKEFMSTTNQIMQMQLDSPPGIYLIDAIVKNKSSTAKVTIE